MLDIKPLEWILMNLSKLEQNDQKIASRPVLFHILIPYASSYLAASFLTLKFSDPGSSLRRKLFYRGLVPLAISAIVTDLSYSLNYSKFEEIYVNFRPKYEKLVDNEQVG